MQQRHPGKAYQEVLNAYWVAKNPVTKSVYRSMLVSREERFEEDFASRLNPMLRAVIEGGQFGMPSEIIEQVPRGDKCGECPFRTQSEGGYGTDARGENLHICALGMVGWNGLEHLPVFDGIKQCGIKVY